MVTADDAAMIRDSDEGDRVRKKNGRKGRRRLVGGRLRLSVVAAAAACLAMTVVASPALANWGFHKSIGEKDLETPIGVAVNGSGNVLVGNLFFKKVQTFNLAGDALTQPGPFGSKYVSGVAVNPATENVYIVNALEQKLESYHEGKSNWEPVHAFAIPGTAAYFSGHAAAMQIAADGHGNVYVPDAPANKVEVFDEEGNAPIGVAPEIGGLSGPEGVAIGPNGTVWVADTHAEKIEAFEAAEESGKAVFKLITARTIEGAGHVQAIAVDSSGDVFASVGGEHPHAVEYRPSGAPSAEQMEPVPGAEKIGEGLLVKAKYGTPAGIAFDRTREILYIADSGANLLQRFLSWGATTEPAAGVEKEAATLRGTVNVESGGSAQTCRFEYGTTNAYGETVPCEQEGFNATTAVAAHLTGLTAAVTYHYRLAATNAAGFTQLGEDESFTARGLPHVESQSAEAVVHTATVRAHIAVTEEETGGWSCEVQYVEAQRFAATAFNEGPGVVPCTTPLNGKAGSYDIEGDRIADLSDDTVYDYRLVLTARNGSATYGPVEEFATFGVSAFAFDALGDAEEAVTQAGAHPDDLADKFTLSTSSHTFSHGVTAPLGTDANPKDVITELPPGLVGNADAVPKCKPYDVAHADCNGASQVGTIKLYTGSDGYVLEHGKLEPNYTVPIYNLVPPAGVAAQFGARFNGFVTLHIDARVRTGGDYGVTAEVVESSAMEGVVQAEVTLWGVPAATSHDEQRFCPSAGTINEVAPCSAGEVPRPFLRNPTACTGPREAHMTVEPWQEDEPPVVVGASAKMPPITGCHEVPFTPSIKVTPESSVSDSPTGLHVILTVPQQENPNKLAEADLKDAEVKLPAGMTVNPSSANGLAGCPLLSGKEAHPGVSGIDLENGEMANCPNASKVGVVHIKTPLLEEEVEGGVYVAQQNANPFKSLLALYIAAEAPERGVVVKLAGHVEPNPVTGQLTTTFDENPQLPFETLKLDFFGGERAALATPSKCGTYTASTVLEPWSHMEANGTPTGTPDATPSSEFEINSRCTDPFAPSFTAGTINDHGASFSPFTMALTRNDGEQTLKTVDLTMPPGLSGMISKVTPCANAQAEAGDCPASSKIGHVQVEAGVGGEPVTLPEAGKPEDPVFLTEKYDGAPFGLSIVVPAEAGPFNLGTVVVRARIEVNPENAQVSVLSNPMPTILDGIPLDVKAIRVEVDRPEFMFNPTDCNAMAVAGTIGSAEGASAAVSSHFQAASCAALPFKPKFSALIHARHSRKGGEYLHVVVKSAFGQANIHQVHVQLPGKLPSRLETLKLACTEAQFAANPAGCPAGSFVGHATAHTPILPVAMQGPAIFVSHGGKGFPNLDLVLQGDGVHITLVGDTYINRKSITTSTFRSVPDVPIGRFDLVLPAGPHSALGGNGNMCAGPLYMPTTLTGQNGAVERQRTRVEVAGCKAEIRVRKVRVHGAGARIVVRVPSAGKLIAVGRGIKRAVKRVGRAKLVTITVQLNRHYRHASAKRRLKVRVKVRLRLKPKHGRTLHASTRVLLR